MNKSTAINLLGGSVSKVARELGITSSAVSQWPDELPKSAVEKVQAALWRRAQASAQSAAQRATPEQKAA